MGRSHDRTKLGRKNHGLGKNERHDEQDEKSVGQEARDSCGGSAEEIDGPARVDQLEGKIFLQRNPNLHAQASYPRCIE